MPGVMSQGHGPAYVLSTEPWAAVQWFSSSDLQSSWVSDKEKKAETGW